MRPPPGRSLKRESKEPVTCLPPSSLGFIFRIQRGGAHKVEVQDHALLLDGGRTKQEKTVLLVASNQNPMGPHAVLFLKFEREEPRGGQGFSHNVSPPLWVSSFNNFKMENREEDGWRIFATDQTQAAGFSGITARLWPRQKNRPPLPSAPKKMALLQPLRA